MTDYLDLIECDIPAELPLLPLVSTAVFPHAVVSLQVRMQQSLNMLEVEGAENKIIATVITHKGISKAKSIDDLHDYGVASRIISKVMIPNNTVQLVIQGIKRIKIESLVQDSPYLRCLSQCMKENTTASATETNKRVKKALSLFRNLAEIDGRYPSEMVEIMEANAENPGRFADLLSNYLNFSLGEKQYLVSAIDYGDRLERLVRLMIGEIHKLQVAKEVENQVQVDLNKNQREYYLRQQLNAIKRTLGEDKESDSEIVMLKKKVEEANLPEKAKKVAERELERLALISSSSAEYNVIRTYIDWIIELPWNKSSKDNLDIKSARKILDEDHYGLAKVKDRIIEFLAIRQRSKDLHGPILCLAGPPGVGKTSLGKSIARALERDFIRMSVGGMRDEAEIRGHRRTYIGAMPGKIIQEIRNCGNNNPLFMIDEIDKMGSDFRGDPSSAMLEVLDPEQNFSFRDLYLDLPFDLSKVFFITTANMLATIPAPLRDRMEVIELSSYTLMEKVKIAQRYLVPRQMKHTGLREGEFEISEEAVKNVAASYTYEAGVRNLERQIASLCRKSVVRILESGVKKISITEENLTEFLGPPRILPNVASKKPQVGIVTGLAWTPYGGEILIIESIKMRGSGRVMVTGQLGQVMEESVQAAHSYVRSKAAELGIKDEMFSQFDIHVHFPEGAIPKDGPSAGVAVTVALISLLTDQPVYADLAMTGEVTLRGSVLPIGGLKEKAIAAYRAGIKRIAFPKDNEKDLNEIPEEVRSKLTLIPVSTVDEALEHALAKIIIPSGDVVEAIETMANNNEENKGIVGQ